MVDQLDKLNYAKTGCPLHPDCLTCPFPDCRADHIGKTSLSTNMAHGKSTPKVLADDPEYNAGNIGNPVPAKVRNAVPGLMTSRKIQILELYAKGYSNTEIGKMLGISRQTVKNQLGYTHDIMGAPTTLRCVILALKQGLFNLDDL